MRINKFFTEQGLCSRREADRLIAEGRVAINGRMAKLGDHVSPQDLVTRDGTAVQRGHTPVYIKYHKPVGVTTTTESHIRRNIIAEIGHGARIFPIGRLDKDSSGLILLTNDGDIVNDILRVEHGHEREYRVEVDREFDEAFLARLSQGVMVLGVPTRPCIVARLAPRRLCITLKEGRNRQIRRMCQALGYRVVSLHRVRIMHITIEGLHAGQWRDLSREERDRLFRAVGRSVERPV
ncbi:MAG: putative Pseudouridine synthase [Nitrospira sp.]|jgi:23S rRNA pseudouridine2604 synthase|nr:putative Pseudouridine synthase [Nitrospira sp.]